MRRITVWAKLGPLVLQDILRACGEVVNESGERRTRLEVTDMVIEINRELAKRN